MLHDRLVQPTDQLSGGVRIDTFDLTATWTGTSGLQQVPAFTLAMHWLAAVKPMDLRQVSSHRVALVVTQGSTVVPVHSAGALANLGLALVSSAFADANWATDTTRRTLWSNGDPIEGPPALSRYGFSTTPTRPLIVAPLEPGLLATLPNGVSNRYAHLIAYTYSANTTPFSAGSLRAMIVPIDGISEATQMFPDAINTA